MTIISRGMLGCKPADLTPHLNSVLVASRGQHQWPSAPALCSQSAPAPCQDKSRCSAAPSKQSVVMPTSQTKALEASSEKAGVQEGKGTQDSTGKVYQSKQVRLNTRVLQGKCKEAQARGYPSVCSSLLAEYTAHLRGWLSL